MKRIVLFLLPATFFLFSCPGLLWEGADKGDLTISIQNPYYTGATATPTSRALALQGKYLYIELALIADQAGYNADANKALSGNGTWINTSWGGHAIVTLDLNNWTSDVSAVFKNVPKSEPLKARAILDIDEASVVLGLDPAGGYYGEVRPLCLTYNPDSTDLFDNVGNYDVYDYWWVDVSKNELSSNALSLPIRVSDSYSYYSVPTFNVLDAAYSEEYVDSSIATYGFTEPDPTTGDYYFPTKFSLISMDLSSQSDNLTDVAIYLLVESTLPVGACTTILYNEDGSPVDEIGGTLLRQFSIGHPILDSSYTNTSEDFYRPFIGSTNIPQLDYDYTNYFGLSYAVSYGILYDSSVSAVQTVLGPPGVLVVSWNVPTGFLAQDLQFEVLYLPNSSSLIESNIASIQQINALSPIILENWSTSSDLSVSDSNFSGSVNNWVIILGRYGSDGVPFIYGRQTVTDGYT